MDIFKSKIPQLLNVKANSNTEKILCGPNKTCLWVDAGCFVSSGLARRRAALPRKGQAEGNGPTKRLRRSSPERQEGSNAASSRKAS